MVPDKDYLFPFFGNSLIMEVSKGYRGGTCAAESCPGRKGSVVSPLLMPCKNCFHLSAGKQSGGCNNCRICQIKQRLKYPSLLHPIPSPLPVSCLIQDIINSLSVAVALLTAQHSTKQSNSCLRCSKIHLSAPLAGGLGPHQGEGKSNSSRKAGKLNQLYQRGRFGPHENPSTPVVPVAFLLSSRDTGTGRC